MVIDVEPITNVAAVAVDRQFLSANGIDDHKRDEFFWKLIWSVIVGAIRDRHRQTMRVRAGTDEKIAARLARCVWRLRIVSAGLGEWRLIGPKRAEYFIGRYVVESPARHRGPSGLQGAFQERMRPDNIGAHESGTRNDRAVNVAFRGKMDDKIEIVTAK